MSDAVPVPSLWRDRSFWALNATQFLGAFNDNLFKQLVLLLCVDRVKAGLNDYDQAGATLVFSAPFIIFSGFAGFVSDRFSKRTLIVACKVAEIGIVLTGAVGFYLQSMPLLFATLGMLGTHSAFFGPPKYGILPELFRGSDLPRANGAILLTTFLAVIFGLAVAGILKTAVSGPPVDGVPGSAGNLWIASVASIFLALLGVGTSIFLRNTGVAAPHLRFEPSSLLIPADTARMMWRDRTLLKVILASSMFWLVGSMVYPMAINDFGKLTHHLTDAATGIMAAGTGFGIAAGCVVAGILSRDRVRPSIIRLGLLGLLICLILLALPSGRMATPLLPVVGAAFVLVVLGFSAGLFSVPVQVFLQARALPEQKGRIIGVMNLCNWVGIAFASFIYSFSQSRLKDAGLPVYAVFAVAAVLMLILLAAFRPPSIQLSHADNAAV